MGADQGVEQGVSGAAQLSDGHARVVIGDGRPHSDRLVEREPLVRRGDLAGGTGQARPSNQVVGAAVTRREPSETLLGPAAGKGHCFFEEAAQVARGETALSARASLSL